MKRVLIVQNNLEEDLGLYVTYLRETSEVTVIRAFESLKEILHPSVDDFDAFVVGPTPISANDVQQHDFLRNEWGYLGEIIASGKPCLGVCCGGQMLALALGGSVVKSPSKEIGGYTVKLTEDGINDSLFNGFPVEFPVFHWHAEMFTVPPGGYQLVSGDPCPVQGFRKGNVWGIIFHLEVTSKDAVRWAEAYSEEPKEIGKSVGQVIEECRLTEDVMTKLAKQLVNNFISVTP